MAFKMKNAALKKQVEVAACPRTAMKMAAKDAAMKKMHSPAKAMKTPMKKMDAPTKAMKESATKFNAELKKASAEGKLKGKFKEAVDSAPMRKMDDGKKTTPKGGRGEAGMTAQDRKIKRLQEEIIKARDEGNDRRITEIYKELRDMYKTDKSKKSPNKAMKETPAKAMKSPMKEMRAKKKSSLDPRMDRGRDSMRGRKKSDLREREKKDPSLEYKLGKFGGERGTTLTSVGKTNKKTTTPPSKDNYQTTIDKKRKKGIGYKTTYKKDESGKVIESGITFDDGTYLRD